jgi:tetratricopeptide (TPR) repeat protein
MIGPEFCPGLSRTGSGLQSRRLRRCSSIIPKAKEAATQALVLDPLLAEAHTALAVVKARYEFDLPGAEKEFLRAIELNPNSTIAHRSYSRAYLSSMKRHREAIDEMKKAVELDPLSPETHYFLAGAYDDSGEFDRAVEEFRHVIEMDPNYGQNRLQFAHLLADLGRFEESIAEFEKGETLVGTNPDKAAQHAAALRHAFQTKGAKGYWQESLSLGLQTLKESDQYWFNTPIHIAEAYSRLGEKDKAFEWLEKAYQERDGIRLGFVNSNDGFNKLHGDPRYSDLLRRVGLPE